MIKYCLIIACACTLAAAQVFAAELTEANPAYLSHQGFACYQRADYANAIKMLSARTHLKPEDANVYYYLGNCFLKTNQIDQAAHMYSSCVRVSADSAAGKCALKALEDLSSTARPAIDTKANAANSAAQAAAVKDSLLTDQPLDQRLNESNARIKSQRQTVKSHIDRIWSQLADELQSMSPRSTPNYAVELERVRREAENTVESLQTKQLRYESRLSAPESIDVRAVPQKPEEKNENTKTALGSLYDYFKPDKPYDPFDTAITPEMISKFLSIRDVFGELSTYQPAARKMARQVFIQLKRSIENKQDTIDQQIYQIKANLIRDITTIKSNAGNTYVSNTRQMTAAYHLSTSTIPRADNPTNLTQSDKDLSDAVERTTRRVKDLEAGYYRDVDSYISGAKERLGAMVAQAGLMNSQLKKASGTIQLVPIGTDTYTRNYINFGDRDVGGDANLLRNQTVQPLRAQAQIMKKKPANLSSRSRAGVKQ